MHREAVIVCAALRERVRPVLRSASPATLSGLTMMRRMQSDRVSTKAFEDVTLAHSSSIGENESPAPVRAPRWRSQREKMRVECHRSAALRPLTRRSTRRRGAGILRASYKNAETRVLLKWE